MDPEKEEKENEEKMEFSQGVLVALSCLERRARGRALLGHRRQRLREQRETLRARLRELRHRRDTLRDSIQHLAQGNSGIPWQPREVLLWRIRELRDLLRLFPLTGVSGRRSRHGLSVSLHTAFEGSLLDSFHLELQESQKPQEFQESQKPQKSQESQKPQEFREFRELRVRRHSVPPFIPLAGLERELLPRSPREFLRVLLELLTACGARRHQLHLLQEEFSECLQGIPSSNSLCNLLSFTCRIPGKNSQIPGKNPQIPGKNSQIPENPEIPGKNPKISRKNSEFGGKNPQIPRKKSEFGGENPEICGNNPQIPGKNSQIPEIPGKIPEIPGKIPKISRKKSDFGGKNPEIWGENPEICGKNSEFGGKNSEFDGENSGFDGKNLEFDGENPGFGGKSPGFGGKNSGNSLELRARLRYRDPLRSLPTDVELSVNGQEAPGELRALLGSRSLPRALRQILEQNSQKILEFPAGSG